MTTVNLCRCDSCGRTSPSAGDESSPDGWIWLHTMCGGGFDACSTACAMAILKEHDHTEEMMDEPKVKLAPKAKDEKPS